MTIRKQGSCYFALLSVTLRYESTPPKVLGFCAFEGFSSIFVLFFVGLAHARPRFGCLSLARSHPCIHVCTQNSFVCVVFKCVDYLRNVRSRAPGALMGVLFCNSADAGWDDLKGYDMSTGESNVLTKFVGGANEIFVVQVRKGVT